ncbi:MAG TPA: sigma-54 dependent transcriptional regulator, partial [Hyphomicrobiaceae bacterium]|nr:sigma-54 dependent transcriptional regulator [Hyphomicrobiaceae bacterium]
GLVGQLAEIERTRIELGVSGDLLESYGRANDPMSTLEAGALALQLGKHPRVLATQVLTLLESLRICDSAVLCEEESVATKPTAPGVEVLAQDARPNSKVVFPVGSHEGRSYSVLATAPESTNLSMAWFAIDQIIQSAAATANPRAFHDDDIALWPSETSATELRMVVVAETMRDVLNTGRKLASSNITVLITGESGAGKEVVARGLHEASLRKDKPFIPFNCSAVARDMLDAQLFGYRRGAFTGAQEAFQGVIRAASGGTLFLDEIGETSLDVQPKLLRFLESGEIHPLGEPKPIEVDVRVVAATNADLEQLVTDGRFREDLFYRLNVVRLHVPPLRERREEIPPLVQHYLQRCAHESRKTGIRFAEETMEYLVLYRWPGNVRQLANEVRRLVALAEPGAVLMPEHLSHDIRASRRTIAASTRALAPTEFVVRLDQPLSAAMEHVERTMVENALTVASGRLEDAAQLLGVSRKGLYLKRQRLGIADVVNSDKELVTANSS